MILGVEVTAKSNQRKIRQRFLGFFMIGIMLFSLSACTDKTGKDTNGQISNGTSNSEPIIIERQAEPDGIKMANSATALALRHYVSARIKTEEFLSIDVKTISKGEIAKRIDDVVLAWETADALASGAVEITDTVIASLDPSLAKQTAASEKTEVKFSTLAWTDKSVSAVSLLASSETKVDSQTWAENLTKQYDALSGGKRYSQLAKQLGIDTKTAVEQMALAQKLIRNAADLEEAQAEVAAYTQSINIVEGYKTASKVGLFVGATIATGGGSLSSLAGSSVTLGKAGAVIVGGVDCIVAVGETTSSIVLGENHQVTIDYKNASDVLQPLSMVLGLATMNPNDTVDQIAMVGESIMEWFNPGKITAVGVEKSKALGTKIIAQLIEAAENDIPGIKKALEKLGLALPSEKGISVSELQKSYTVNAQTALASMSALKVEIAKLDLEGLNQNPSPPLIPGETSPSTIPPQDKPDAKKTANYEIRNESGMPWVIDSSTDPKYFDDLDGLYASDLTVAPDEKIRGGFDVKVRIQQGVLIELSPTTYSGTVTIAAGAVPEDEDEQYVYFNPLYGQTAQIYQLTITGVYGEYAVIEWDGTSFKQVK